MTTKRGPRPRYARLLTSLKLTLVGLVCLILVWLISWFARSELPASTQADGPAALASPNRLIVLPTLYPLPAPRPTLAIPPEPWMPGLPEPASFSASAPAAEAALPRPAAGSPATTVQMPELKPIPPLPPAPAWASGGPAARTRGS